MEVLRKDLDAATIGRKTHAERNHCICSDHEKTAIDRLWKRQPDLLVMSVADSITK